MPWRKHRRFGGCGAVRFASVPGAGHPRWGSSVTHPGSASNGSQFLLLTSLLNFTLCAVFILARKSVKPDAMPLRRGLRGGSFSVHRSSPARGKPRRAPARSRPQGGRARLRTGQRRRPPSSRVPCHAQTLGPPGICPILRLDGEYLQSRRLAAVESSNFLPPGTVTTAAVGCSSLHLAEVAGLGPGHSRPQRGHPRLGRTRTSVSGHARPGHAAPARRSRWETGRRPQCGFHTNPPAAQLTRPLSSFFPTRYFISSKMHIFHILTF